jgi:hypothetical protein
MMLTPDLFERLISDSNSILSPGSSFSSFSKYLAWFSSLKKVAVILPNMLAQNWLHFPFPCLVGFSRALAAI